MILSNVFIQRNLNLHIVSCFSVCVFLSVCLSLLFPSFLSKFLSLNDFIHSCLLYEFAENIDTMWQFG